MAGALRIATFITSIGSVMLASQSRGTSTPIIYSLFILTFVLLVADLALDSRARSLTLQEKGMSGFSVVATIAGLLMIGSSGARDDLFDMALLLAGFGIFARSALPNSHGHR